MKLRLALLIGVGLLFASEALMAKSTDLILHTSEGDITVELEAEKAPITRQNFLLYVNKGYYNGTLFHRVIPGFMIQGGGFLPGMKEKSPIAAPVQHEGSQCGENKRGTIAMARTNDPNSATSQFFINTVDNAFLDFQSETPQGWGYCAFGHVIKGMDVVDKIQAVPTTSRDGFQDVPVNDVLINSIELVG